MKKFYRKNKLNKSDNFKEIILKEQINNKVNKEYEKYKNKKHIRNISLNYNFEPKIINKKEKLEHSKFIKRNTHQVFKNLNDNSFSNLILNQFSDKIKKTVINFNNIDNSYNKYFHKKDKKKKSKNLLLKDAEVNKTSSFNIKNLKNNFYIHNIWDINYKSKIIFKPITNYKKRLKKFKLQNISHFLN